MCDRVEGGMMSLCRWCLVLALSYVGGRERGWAGGVYIRRRSLGDGGL
jgi:hypothetical protein